MTTETTQPGVSADPEAQFQGFFDAGAFDPEPPKQVEDTPEAEPPPRGDLELAKEPEAQAPELEANADPGQTPERPSEDEYASLEDLLKAQKIDPESVKSLPVTVKIDGKEQQVPLSEVLKSYQLEGHVNNKSIELSNQQKQFEAEQQAARGLIQQQLVQNQHLANLAMQQLNHEYSQINWQQLRATDPGQYAALLTDYQARQGQIQASFAHLNQQQTALAQEEQAKTQQKIVTEKAAMLEKHPEWKDTATWTAAQTKMVNIAKNLGFTDAELSSVQDHRFMDLLHLAASQAELQAATPEALKRVREAPKTAKAGTRQNTDPASAQKQKAIERFNRNPRDVDAQAALFSVLAA